MAQDLDNELGEFLALPPISVAVGTGTATFAGVDIRDYVGKIKLLCNQKSQHNLVTNSVVYTVLDSADNSTFAANSDITPFTTTGSAVVGTISVDTRATERYIQLEHKVTGTTQTVVLSVVGVGQKQVV